MKSLIYILIILPFILINIPLQSTAGVDSSFPRKNDTLVTIVAEAAPAIDLTTLPYVTKEILQTNDRQRVRPATGGTERSIRGVRKTGIFTCYTSRVEETDSSPFITASGQRVRNGIIANNCLNFKTKLRINYDFSRKDGNTGSWRWFEIQDRMNSRYGCNHFDIYWGGEEALESCREFGRKELNYIVL